MKSHVTRSFLFAAICVVCALLPSAALRAQAPAPAEDPKLAADEKEACTRNLKLIYDAIQKYRADHKDLPNWLSDLVPLYLDDVNVLICPACRRTGESETGPLSDPKISSSYLFEFCPVPLREAAPGDPTRTRREWKRRQMGIAGSIVPIVRCRHHDHTLNLAYDGRIYESGSSWETLLTNEVNVAELAPARIFPGDGKTNATHLTFPPRDPETSSNLINLTAYYNATLKDSWLGRPDNDLASLPTGMQKLGGVDYDVRGIIQLAGKPEASKRYPKSVKGIAINQKCARLHFLHAVAFGTGTDVGMQVGSYIVHFASNQMQLEIPLYYGHELRDWHTLPNEITKAKELNMVWTGTNTVSAAAHKSIRLFATTWDNVAPGVEIKNIDFVSTLGPSAPFLVAITAE